MDTAVEPTQLGLAVGVDVVIDVEYFPPKSAFLFQQLSETVEPMAGLRRDAYYRSSGETLVDETFQFAESFGVQLVDAVDGDGVGFLELLAENVSRLRR